MIIVHECTPMPAEMGVPTVHVVPDVAAAAGPWIAKAVTQVIQQTGRCRLALAGGSTPGPTYRWLRDHLATELYGQLWVTLTDERALRYDALPPERWAELPADSNLRLVMAEWLAHVGMDPRRILPLTLGGAAGPECVRFGQEFMQKIGGGIDVAVLESLMFTTVDQYNNATEQQVWDLAVPTAAHRDADGLFVACTQLPTLGILERLRAQCGKPVWGAIQATALSGRRIIEQKH